MSPNSVAGLTSAALLPGLSSAPGLACWARLPAAPKATSNAAAPSVGTAWNHVFAILPPVDGRALPLPSRALPAPPPPGAWVTPPAPSRRVIGFHAESRRNRGALVFRGSLTARARCGGGAARLHPRRTNDREAGRCPARRF